MNETEGKSKPVADICSYTKGCRLCEARIRCSRTCSSEQPTLFSRYAATFVAIVVYSRRNSMLSEDRQQNFTWFNVCACYWDICKDISDDYDDIINNER